VSWQAVQDQMRQQRVYASTAGGILGILLGLILLNRPVPRWVSLLVLADGGALTATGSGLITRLVSPLFGGSANQSSGNSPSKQEV
jgi:hypothetical protein